eukprot:Rmarinus@m.23646
MIFQITSLSRRRSESMDSEFAFSLGLLMSFFSALALPSIVGGHPSKFAIPYSAGNLLSLGSTSFLVGPWKQMQSMCDPTRAIASTVYLISLVATLYVALIQPLPKANALLVLFLLVLQFSALIWYCASYVPFARRCIRNALETV